MKFLWRLFSQLKIRYMPGATVCIIHIFLFILCWLIILLNDYFPEVPNWQIYVFGGW